jgi:hypothetical protein
MIATRIITHLQLSGIKLWQSIEDNCTGRFQCLDSGNTWHYRSIVEQRGRTIYLSVFVNRKALCSFEYVLSNQTMKCHGVYFVTGMNEVVLHGNSLAKKHIKQQLTREIA